MELLDGACPDSPSGESRDAAGLRPPASSLIEMLGAPAPPPGPKPPRWRSSWRPIAGAGLAVAVGVAAGSYATSAHDTARARNAAGVRARSMVDLAVLHVSASLDNDGRLRVLASLRNRGPQPLVILGARLGRVSLGGQDANVPAGRTWPGVGILPGTCPIQADVQGPLVVDVRTADGVGRAASLQPGRDFLLQMDDLPDPVACRSPGFEAAYVEAGLVSATRRGQRGTRLVLSLVAQLPEGAQRARLVAVGVHEPGIVARVVAGLPATVSTGQPAIVTVDVTAPSCGEVKLPNDSTAGPYLSFRGHILPGGDVSTAPGYEANTVLVAVLRMLARACPRVLTD